MQKSEFHQKCAVRALRLLKASSCFSDGEEKDEVKNATIDAEKAMKANAYGDVMQFVGTFFSTFPEVKLRMLTFLSGIENPDVLSDLDERLKQQEDKNAV